MGETVRPPAFELAPPCDWDELENDYTVAHAYYADAKYPQAIEACRRAVSVQTEKLGAQHFEVANSYCLMGEALTKLARYSEAVGAFTLACKIRAATLGMNHPSVIDVTASIFFVMETQ